MDFFEWFSLNWFEVLTTFISLLVALIVFFKTKDYKKFLEVLKDMKFRLPNYLEKEEPEVQTFSKLKPVYKLNKITGELEDTGEVIDIDEYVNSFKDQALQVVLERFMPALSHSDDVLEYQDTCSDLDLMQESFLVADSYRVKYGLSDDLSVRDVFKVVSDKAQELKKKVDAFSVKNKSEVVKNEKTEEVVAQCEQTQVQPNGEESSQA